MKKLLSLIAIAILYTSTTFAQKTAPAKVTAQVAVKKAQPGPVKTKAIATTPAKKEVKKSTASTKATDAKLKADGTPDMRYKDNKAKQAAVAGPKKKDGTADMRYKANKPATKKN